MFNHNRHVSRFGSFIKGVVVGGITLGTAALLWAPKKGIQLRRELKKGANKVKRKAQGTKRAIKKSTRRIKRH